jgi:hypothetical protein
VLKHGTNLIRDLLEDDPEEDLEKLLSLSTMIAIKVRTDGLDDKKRRRFAYIFRNAAFLIENEKIVNESLWNVFWGKTTDVKSKTGEDNV